MRNVVTRLSGIILAVAVGAQFGCNDQPTPAKTSSGANKSDAKPSQPATQLSDADKTAMRSLAGGPAGDSGAGGAAPQGLPPGHPPISSDASAPAASATPASPPPPAEAAGDLQFEKAPAWKATPVRSAMRRAQYLLQKVESDSDDAEVVVFYFGRGEGGPVMENLKRWKGQFSSAEGTPLPEDAGKQETLEANGFKVSLLDISGSYVAAAMAGVGDTKLRPNYRMLAAIIETPQGPWFVKATGPAATMAANQDAIRKFILSAKPSK